MGNNVLLILNKWTAALQVIQASGSNSWVHLKPAFLTLFLQVAFDLEGLPFVLSSPNAATNLPIEELPLQPLMETLSVDNLLLVFLAGGGTAFGIGVFQCCGVQGVHNLLLIFWAGGGSALVLWCAKREQPAADFLGTWGCCFWCCRMSVVWF